jgi:hypothetical protein
MSRWNIAACSWLASWERSLAIAMSRRFSSVMERSMRASSSSSGFSAPQYGQRTDGFTGRPHDEHGCSATAPPRPAGDGCCGAPRDPG